ncbi:MAG TPA: amino acid--tRNA ligase-related protein [Candidatus Paceibacterota bacterium]|nr:amino acid--tRNA ligase-related protein [Candidatus Paceibacterota bacterium]
MLNNYSATKDTSAFSAAARMLRLFFMGKGFLEAHTQDRLSILAACEDPTTVAAYDYLGKRWPLPQTGQMWLECELLENPGRSGVFCMSTSYRHEPSPVPGRHEVIFPMFEFEAPGGMDDLRRTEVALCEHLGFGSPEMYRHIAYDEAARFYGVSELTAEHEARMEKDFGPVVFLESFPNHTSPFWNMRRDGGYARKIDVILCGMETVGSAERSIDRRRMRTEFTTISDGGYARLLYDKFGEDRVRAELEEFLSLDFFPRYGGGIGMTRLIRAMKKRGLV